MVVMKTPQTTKPLRPPSNPRPTTKQRQGSPFGNNLEPHQLNRRATKMTTLLKGILAQPSYPRGGQNK